MYEAGFLICHPIFSFYKQNLKQTILFLMIFIIMPFVIYQIYE